MEKLISKPGPIDSRNSVTLPVEVFKLLKLKPNEFQRITKQIKVNDSWLTVLSEDDLSVEGRTGINYIEITKQ